MKTTYIQPNSEMIRVTASAIMASSTVTVTVSDEDFNGEGRVKDTEDWYDIWDNN